MGTVVRPVHSLGNISQLNDLSLERRQLFCGWSRVIKGRFLRCRGIPPVMHSVMLRRSEVPYLSATCLTLRQWDICPTHKMFYFTPMCGASSVK
jgi:hypothetical protein